MIASSVVNVPINSESSRLITVMLQVLCPARQINLWRPSRCPELAIPDPPEQRSHAEEGDQREQHDQRSLLDPGDGRYEKPHDEAKNANLPRGNVHAGDKRPESQQKKNGETGC